MNIATQRRWMLAAMFFAGALTGATIVAGAHWRYLQPPSMPSGNEIVSHIREELHSELHVTFAQDQAIIPILDRHGTELDAIRLETLAKVRASIEAKNAGIITILNPAQKQKFEANEAKRLQRFEENEKPPLPGH